MAYNPKELLNNALLEIEKKKLVFHEDVIAILGIHKSTYYTHFPNNSDYHKIIEQELQKNKITLKAGIRSKWYNEKSGNGSLYLYKLIGSEMERERLSTNYNKVQGTINGAIAVGHLDLSKITDVNVLKQIRQAIVLENQNVPEIEE